MRELDMLLGVLYGDCLGAPYEFSSGPLTGPLQVGPSVFGHPAGPPRLQVIDLSS